MSEQEQRQEKGTTSFLGRYGKPIAAGVAGVGAILYHNHAVNQAAQSSQAQYAALQSQIEKLQNNQQQGIDAAVAAVEAKYKPVVSENEELRGRIGNLASRLEALDAKYQEATATTDGPAIAAENAQEAVTDIYGQKPAAQDVVSKPVAEPEYVAPKETVVSKPVAEPEYVAPKETAVAEPETVLPVVSNTKPEPKVQEAPYTPAPKQVAVAPVGEAKGVEYFAQENYELDRAGKKAIAEWQVGNLKRAVAYAEDSSDRELQRSVWLARAYERVERLGNGVPSDSRLNKAAQAVDSYSALSGGQIPGELKTRLNEVVEQNLDAMIEYAKTAKGDNGFVRFLFGFPVGRQARNVDYKLKAIEDLLSPETKRQVTLYRQQMQVIGRTRDAGFDTGDIMPEGKGEFSKGFATPELVQKLYAAEEVAYQMGQEHSAKHRAKWQKKADKMDERRVADLERVSTEEDAGRQAAFAERARRAAEKKGAYLASMEKANPIRDDYATEIANNRQEILQARAIEEVAEAQDAMDDANAILERNHPGAKDYGKGSFSRERHRKKLLQEYQEMAFDPTISDNGQEAFKAPVRRTMEVLRDAYLIPLGNSSEMSVARDYKFTDGGLEEQIAAAVGQENPQRRLRSINRLIERVEKADSYEVFNERYAGELATLHAARAAAMSEAGIEATMMGGTQRVTAVEVARELGVETKYHDPEQSKFGKFFDDFMASRSVLPSIFLIGPLVNAFADPHQAGYFHQAKLTDIGLNYDQFETHVRAINRDIQGDMYLTVTRDWNGAFEGIVLSDRPVYMQGNKIHELGINEAVEGRSLMPSYRISAAEAGKLEALLQQKNLTMRKQAWDFEGDGKVDVFSMNTAGDRGYTSEGTAVLKKKMNRDELKALGMFVLTWAKNAAVIYSLSNGGGKGGKGGNNSGNSSSGNGFHGRTGGPGATSGGASGAPAAAPLHMRVGGGAF